MFRHPNSTPSRPSTQDSGNLKPPKAPDRPLVPYMRFSRKMWAKVRSEHPDSQLWDIGKVIGQMWRDAPESEKSVYQQEYEIEKTEYDKALKAYHNSTAYQQYLSAKNRAKMADKSNTVGGVIASSRGRLDTGGVVLQPVEDEEVCDLSSRRIAAVRFDRNHRLIAELFNGNVVTDTRTIVAQSRIDMLQKQAHSLALHQSKLEDELKKLNDVFQEKKRQMETSSEEFASRLKKVCEDKPQVDEAKYVAMVEEWSNKMLRAYEDFKAKQDAIRAKQLVEREQLAEETPILYSLTVSDTSPLPRQKDAVEESEHQSKVVVATKAAGGDENKVGAQLESTAPQTVPAESTANTAQEKNKEDEKMEVDSTTPTEGQEESTVNTPPTSTSPAQETAVSKPPSQETAVSRPPAQETAVSRPPAQETAVSKPPAQEEPTSEPTSQETVSSVSLPKEPSPAAQETPAQTQEAVPEAQAQAQATEPTPESTVVSNQEASPTTQVNCASQEATSDSSATETKAPEQEAKMPESTTPTVNEANSTERVD